MVGFLLYQTKCKARIPPFLALLGWIAATASGLAVLYGLYDHTTGNPMDVDTAAFYNAMNRPVWGAVVCWVIFACASGYGGPINTFLSWSWLLPLSRLCYSAYMVHIPVLNYYFQIQRTQFYMNDTNLIFSFLAVLWVTFFVAFINSMAFEGPFLGLEKLVLAFMAWVGRLVCRPFKGRSSRNCICSSNSRAQSSTIWHCN